MAKQKIKLQDRNGGNAREITVEGDRDAPFLAVVVQEPFGVYGLSVRDDPDGANVYSRFDSILVIPE